MSFLADLQVRGRLFPHFARGDTHGIAAIFVLAIGRRTQFFQRLIRFPLRKREPLFHARLSLSSTLFASSFTAESRRNVCASRRPNRPCPLGHRLMILADPGGGQVGGLFPPLQFQRGACRKISVWFPTLPSPILNSNSC